MFLIKAVYVRFHGNRNLEFETNNTNHKFGYGTKFRFITNRTAALIVQCCGSLCIHDIAPLKGYNLGLARQWHGLLSNVMILSLWFSEHWNVTDNDDNDAPLEGCEQEPSSLREFQHSPPYHILPPLYCRWCLVDYESVIADSNPTTP
jgi:hypothetical protein